MLKTLSYPNVQNIEESVNQFFSYHENTKNLQSELSRIDTELFLCEHMLLAIAKIEHNPFEVN